MATADAALAMRRAMTLAARGLGSTAPNRASRSPSACGLAFSGLVHGIYLVLVILGVRASWLRARAPRTRPGRWKERQHDLV